MVSKEDFDNVFGDTLWPKEATVEHVTTADSSKIEYLDSFEPCALTASTITTLIL